MRKFLLRSAIVLAVLAALCGIALLIERNSAKTAWERYAAAAKARGVKLSLKDEMLQPSIPDAENFAAVPIFDNLFKPGVSGTAVKLFDLPRSWKPGDTIPTDLDAWRAYFVQENVLAADAPEASPAAILRALDEKFGADWQQLSEAATRSRSRFPVNWSNGYYEPLPHITALTSAANICGLRADAHIAQGDGPAAHDDLHLHLRLRWALEQEPVLISWIVSNSILSIAIERIRRGLAAHVWDDSTLVLIDGDLARIKPLSGYRLATESERAWLNDFHASAQASDRESLKAVITAMTGGNGSSFLPVSLPKSWLYRNQIRSNEYVDEVLKAIDVAAERYVPTSPRSSASSPKPGRLERINYALFYAMMPAYPYFEKDALYTHTRVQCARTAVALERWRLARGAYPEALAALVPGLLPAVPHDVMDGLPLRYRRTEEGGYLLYSIGIDAKDDGGIGTKPVRSEKDAPDWVWKP